MRLGLDLGYWGAGNDAANLAPATEADRLAVGADCAVGTLTVSPLATDQDERTAALHAVTEAYERTGIT